jgi:hypothetical protein
MIRADIVTRSWRSLALGLLAVLAAVAPAAAQDSVLYELTENMSFSEGVTHRHAIAALQGSAKLGVPWCPSAVLVTNPKANTCTITATGTDDVSLATGLGTVSATWASVVHGDNAFDGPELVVLTGSFSGRMDFSPAVLFGVPLGTIEGDLTVKDETGVHPVTGTFRLPFGLDSSGKFVAPRPGQDAFYLSDTGMLIPVRKDELALGIPTVRFEVTFK